MSDQASGSKPAGAEGGALSESSTVSPLEIARMLEAQGHTELFAVSPLIWCPHLDTVKPVPKSGIDTSLPCETCNDTTENWVCLVCYKVFCSRFVNEHMVLHGVSDQHLVCLSFSDLSTWCYGCDHYVDNEIIFQAKDAAHQHKFGTALKNPRA